MSREMLHLKAGPFDYHVFVKVNRFGANFEVCAESDTRYPPHISSHSSKGYNSCSLATKQEGGNRGQEKKKAKKAGSPKPRRPAKPQGFAPLTSASMEGLLRKFTSGRGKPRNPLAIAQEIADLAWEARGPRTS